MASTMQFVDQVSTHRFPSTTSSYRPANRASSMQSSFHQNNKPEKAKNGCKRKYQDSTKHDGSRFKRRGREHQNRHDFVNLNTYEDIGDVIEVAFNHQHLSNRNTSAVWHCLSKMITNSGNFQKQHQERHLSQLHHKLNTLLTLTTYGSEEYTPMQLNQTALSMAKIIKAVRFHGNEQTSYHQVFWDLLIGRGMKRKESLFRGITYAAVPLLRRFDPQGYSSIVYACAIADVNPTFRGSTLFECVADGIIALGDLGSFQPLNLSNIVWAFATAKVCHRHLFDKVAHEVVDHRDLRDFKEQALSNILWAYATARVPCPLLFKKVADKVVAHNHLGLFKPQALSNIVWAFATAQVSHESLFDKVAGEVIARHNLRSFNSQDLSMIVWAYAVAKASCPPLFEKLACEVFARHDLGYFNPQALSNIVWAFAKANVSNISLFDKVAGEVVERRDLRSFKPQDLNNIVWAYATAQVSNVRLFCKVAGELNACRELESFDPRYLSSIVSSYAVAKVSAPVLFEGMAYAVLARRDELAYREISTIL